MGNSEYSQYRGEKNKRQYTCYQCEKQYTRQSNLKKHIQSVHAEIKYPCDLCDKQFTEKGHLKKHIQSVHKKESQVSL